MKKPVSILFVCLGNICRSPAAEGILRHMAAKDAQLHIESCGMGDWHVGKLPDARMQEAAKRRQIILCSRAQLFKPSFLDSFEYILAADSEVLQDLFQYANTPAQKAKIKLMTAYSTAYRDQEVPDPYYEGDAGFELVLDMLEDSCQGLLSHLRS